MQLISGLSTDIQILSPDISKNYTSIQTSLFIKPGHQALTSQAQASCSGSEQNNKP